MEINVAKKKFLEHFFCSAKIFLEIFSDSWKKKKSKAKQKVLNNLWQLFAEKNWITLGINILEIRPQNHFQEMFTKTFKVRFETFMFR